MSEPVNKKNIWNFNNGLI